MKIYNELKSLGFFEWLDDEHFLVDTDMKPEYLNELPLTAIHITVANAMAFRWFREKYNLEYQIIKLVNGNYSVVIHLNTQEYLNKILTLQNACLDEIVDCYSYEEAELACIEKLIEIVKNNKS